VSKLSFDKNCPVYKGLIHTVGYPISIQFSSTFTGQSFQMAFYTRVPYRIRVITLLYFLILITYLDRATISIVGVRIKAAFHLTNTQFGWVIGSFALAYALFEIPSALLGDRIGQRKVFLRIVIWWSVFTALTGAVNGLMGLMAVRFLFGVGESGAFPNSTGVVSRWIPKSESTRANSWISMGSSTGAALAPLIVVPLAVAYGWRVPFFVNAIFGLVWVVICFLWFRNNPGEMKKISTDEIKLIEENRNYIQHNHSFDWQQLFRNSMLWALCLSYFCIQWANYFFIGWMPNYLQEGKHFSEQEMKMTTSYLFAFAILSAFLCGVLSDKLIKMKGISLTRRSMALFSFAMMIILIFISIKSSNHATIIVSLISAYFFLPSITLTCFSTCVDIGAGKATTIAGIMNFFGQSGSFIMSILFGKMVDLSHSFESPQYLMAGVLLIGGLCWVKIDASKKINF
jgi:MFS transporter, ACS family, glucarate transporter